MSSSSGYPARWAAGRGWLGRALGSLLAGVRLRPRGSSAAQLSCPAQLPSSAAQLGWPAWLASISGQLGWVVWSATDPFRVRRGFFLGTLDGNLFFPLFFGLGMQSIFGKEASIRNTKPALAPAELASRAASQAGQPSWPAKLACQAGSGGWVVDHRLASCSCYPAGGAASTGALPSRLAITHSRTARHSVGRTFLVVNASRPYNSNN